MEGGRDGEGEVDKVLTFGVTDRLSCFLRVELEQVER